MKLAGLIIICVLVSCVGFSQTIPSWSIPGQTVGYDYDVRGNQIYRFVSTNKSNDFEYDEISLKMYPNPTSSIINIELEEGDKESFLIYTMDGRLVEGVQVNGRLVLDVSNYSNGKYFLVSSREDFAGQVLSFVVIK